MRGVNLPTSTKWHIVIAVEKGVQKVSTIARQYKCSVSQVNRIVQRYRSTSTVESSPRTSTPVKLSPDLLQQIDDLIEKKNKSTSSYLSSELYKTAGVQISARSIRRARRSLTFTPHTPRFRLPMTPAQRAERHSYAIKHSNDDVKKWIFEDETTAYLMKTGNLIWVKRGEEIPVRYISDVNARVRIWGIIRWAGRIFGIVKGTENQSVYICWLSTHFGSQTHLLRDCMFIHDHQSWHQTERVKKWIEDHGMEMVLNPVRSPEFNAIEYIWAWLKHDISTQEPTDQMSLEAAVRKSCRVIDQEIIQHNMQHVQHLMQEEATK